MIYSSHSGGGWLLLLHRCLYDAKSSVGAHDRVLAIKEPAVSTSLLVFTSIF